MSRLRFTESDLQKLRNKTKPDGKPVPEPTGPLESLLKAPRKIREKEMNQTETAFSLVLESARLRGEIERWEFEPVSLKVAPNTRYNPDFLAVLPNGHWQLVEIKGFLRDDAAVKFKTAAEKYPELSFLMIKRKRGEWEIIYNLPSKNHPYHGEQTKIIPSKT